MNQPSKPFNIDKRKVYEAYLQVSPMVALLASTE
jgi:hypothetical protein